MNILIPLLITVLSSNVFAGQLKDKAIQIVPGGSVVQEKLKEVKVQTLKGSLIEVEFDSSGNFEEASGVDLERDTLVPGDGILGLEAVLQSLLKQGKTPLREWTLERSLLKGWHYEFEGQENGKNYEYIVDAKTGKLIESRLDD